MSINRFLRRAAMCALLSMTGAASAVPTFSILGSGTTETPPYDIESASPNFDPPWGIQQFPAETIYRGQSPSTGTTLSLSAPADVTFQYLGHGDANFVNEFKVFDAGGTPILIWCTQGSSIVGCPEAKINPGFENGPTTPFVASTTVKLLNLPAGLLTFEFIGNLSTEGVPGPESGAVFNTAPSNICGLTSDPPIGNPPHPGDVCFGIAIPNGAGTSGLNSVKLGFKDGGQAGAYDPDYQDMAIMVTISSAEVAVPATSPQGLLALTLFLAVAAMWRFRKESA
jgi:hypothetical protein